MPTSWWKQGDKQQGFSLIEILVALIVLAVGLLGLASLQSVAIKSNQDADWSGQAQLLALEMADRIRANEEYTACPNAPEREFHTDNYNNPPALSHNCAANACSPAEIAEDDMFEWRARIQQVLPGGAGMVCIDADPSDQNDCTACNRNVNNSCPYLIRLTWNSNRPGNNNPNVFRMASSISRVVFCP